MKSKYLLTAFLSISVTVLVAQTVNFETLRKQTDTSRFVIAAGINFDYSDTDGDYIYKLGAEAGVQLKSKDSLNIYFFVANYQLIRSEGQDFLDNWFAHLRYNYKLSKVIRIEAFAQTQHNQLLEISARNLIGAGIRLKLIQNNELFKMYLGNTYMYEVEESSTFNTRFYDHRNSTYFSVSFTGKESKIEITNTVYYQPLYSDFSDYRILDEFVVKMPITKTLEFNCAFNYYLDNVIPSGNREYYANISLGLGYTFGSNKNW